MKTITVAMVIIIAVMTTGMALAQSCVCPTPEESSEESMSGFMSSLTSQEILDYYGALYAEGDRSPSTIHALRIFEERYGMTTTVETTNVVEVTIVDDPAPVVEETAVSTPTAEPVITTAPVEDDIGGNATLVFVVLIVAMAALVIYIYSRKPEE